MSDRKSFIFRKEWRDALSALPKRDRQAIYEAIIDYGITGQVAEISPAGAVAFSIVKSTLDGDMERQREICRKRSECGKRGGAPKSNDNARKKSDEPKVPQVKKPKPVVVTTGDNNKFEKWLEAQCPYIHKNIPMMSDAEFTKLKTAYGSKAIMEVCMDLENRKDLRKRYTSLYRTLLNWLKNYVKSQQKDAAVRTNNQSAQDRANDAANSVARLLAEDDAG